MSSSGYVLRSHTPSPQEYHDIRKAAGLTPPPLEASIPALAASWICFSAFEESKLETEEKPPVVAMGRVIGDGALFLQIVDIAVHPDHQRKGLGKEIMRSLVEYIDKHAPDAYVSLVADPKGQRLYRQYGFEDCAPSLGMWRSKRVKQYRAAKKAKEEEAALLVESGSS
ncbi:acyl-CoA N-acyltransferase [Mytilinidion resinicola]|uniref:Acyl-CoA N-acyltransferase n=1 Tax=Mytilinidion resinicola TaxID=574789 RepID=A0A6A6Z953_9PEZI|nr:acyl-CoA N-acyltransferase [Mytilinidion resinicola]KAF2817239.1 acyl-CoA N-acyltransferase [Mytilinidion resinicola]